VVGLASSKDPHIYAGGSLATDRICHAGQVKGDDPDTKGYPGHPGWGLGDRLTTSSLKTLGVSKFEQEAKARCRAVAP
jgi:hypothetical protein